MCLIGKPVTGCYTTYMQIAWANIPMLILFYFEYITVVKKYQNEIALNCGFGFAIANPIKATI